MESLKALLVDFDGTLVNTDSANSKAYKIALANFEFEISENDIRSACAGRHWSKFLPELLGTQYTKDLGLKIAAQKRQIYPQFYNQITLNEPLISLLKYLPKDITMALVTNASRESVSAILDIFELSIFFQVIICQEDVTEPKPSPEGYLLAISLLGVKKSNCIALEDSDTGILAAKNAGIPTLKVAPFTK